MARPTDCTPEVTEAICKHLREGLLSVASCAERAGICEKTYHNWRNRGEEGEEPFATFLQRTTRALADAEAVTIECIDKAAKGLQAENADWRAAAWLAERRYRGKWNKPKEDEAPPAPPPTFNVHVHPGPAHQEPTEDAQGG